MEAGLDSLGAVELGNQLQAQSGRALPSHARLRLPDGAPAGGLLRRAVRRAPAAAAAAAAARRRPLRSQGASSACRARAWLSAGFQSVCGAVERAAARVRAGRDLRGAAGCAGSCGGGSRTTRLAARAARRLPARRRPLRQRASSASRRPRRRRWTRSSGCCSSAATRRCTRAGFERAALMGGVDRRLPRHRCARLATSCKARRSAAACTPPRAAVTRSPRAASRSCSGCRGRASLRHRLLCGAGGQPRGDARAADGRVRTALVLGVSLDAPARGEHHLRHRGHDLADGQLPHLRPPRRRVRARRGDAARSACRRRRRGRLVRSTPGQLRAAGRQERQPHRAERPGAAELLEAALADAAPGATAVGCVGGARHGHALGDPIEARSLARAVLAPGRRARRSRWEHQGELRATPSRPRARRAAAARVGSTGLEAPPNAQLRVLNPHVSCGAGGQLVRSADAARAAALDCPRRGRLRRRRRVLLWLLRARSRTASSRLSRTCSRTCRSSRPRSRTSARATCGATRATRSSRHVGLRPTRTPSPRRHTAPWSPWSRITSSRATSCSRAPATSRWRARRAAPSRRARAPR